MNNTNAAIIPETKIAYENDFKNVMLSHIPTIKAPNNIAITAIIKYFLSFFSIIFFFTLHHQDHYFQKGYYL